MRASLSLSVRSLDADVVEGPEEVVGGRVGEGRGDELEAGPGLGSLGVEEEEGMGGPATTRGVEAESAEGFLGFFDLGVRSRRRARRLPIAVVASPTSRSEPLIVIAREPAMTVGDTEIFACDRS
jgi:hypothetical protein